MKKYVLFTRALERNIFLFIFLFFRLALQVHAQSKNADLFINVVSNKTIATVGDEVVFTISIKNNGPNVASNCRVTDVLPSGFSFLNAVPSEGLWEGPIWRVGNLPPNATASIIITGKVNPFGNYTNTVAIKADEPDINLGDNTVKTILGVIRAIDDNAYVNESATGVVIENVLVNDFLNGSFAVISKVDLSQVSSTTSQLNLDVASGKVHLSGTLPSGNYSLNYKITDKANPALFTTAKVNINVNNSNGGIVEAAIVANHDAGTVPETTGGIAVFNVLANDKLGGEKASLANVDLSFLSSTSPKISLDASTGNVLVEPNTPGGPYILNYKITSKTDITVSATSYVTVNVIGTGSLDTKDDYGSANGVSGGVAVVNVLANDLFNGSVIKLEDVNLSVLYNMQPGINLNLATGEVSVAPGTPNGFFTLTYQVSSKTDASNTGAADVIITVTGGVDAINANEDRGLANGTTGGVAVNNILENDFLKGVTPTISDVFISQLFSNNAAINIDFNTGQVIVNPGTRNGFFTLTYLIQDKLDPAKASFADIIIEVTGGISLLTATEDSGSASGVVGGVAVANVLANDDLDGVTPTLTEVTIEQSFSNNPGINLDVNTGQVIVDAGTENGVYTVAYTIQEKGKPESSSYADVIVTVTQEDIHILANPDVGSANGITGGTAVVDVLLNDVLAGTKPLLTQVNLSQVATSNSGINLDLATGSVIVSAGTPNGIYTLSYRIEDKIKPSNFSIADVTVTVNSGLAVISAEDDRGIVNQQTGGLAVANILSNDSLNGIVPHISEVTILQLFSSDPQYFNIDEQTGQALVKPGAPIGFFTIAYQIEDKVNPGLTAVADVIIEVTADAGLLVANDDFGTIIGLTGGVAVADVLNNDLINGVVATLTLVNLEEVSSSNAGLKLELNTGKVLVNSGTAPGDYTLNYRIVSKQDPSKTAEAIVLVRVISLSPIAKNDAGSVNGFLGGIAVNNVFFNDVFKNAPLVLSDVDVPLLSSGHALIHLNLLTGQVNVDPLTPAGVYTLQYKIADKANLGDFSVADVVITVTAPPISATADSGTINGFSGGVAVTNILANDSFNGATASLANVTISQLTANNKITIDPATGNVTVSAGTPAGVYTIDYQITDKLNPTNVAIAKVVLTVTTPSISATADSGTINGFSGGVAVTNILANDSFNGATASFANVIISQLTVNNKITIDPATGNVTVSAGTPAGVYTIDYQITDKLNPTNVAIAKVVVTVTTPSISATADSGTINGFSGGVAVTNILANDSFNGATASFANVTISQLTVNNKITIDPATGNVTVSAETPAGVYTIDYQITDKLNPTNIAIAKVEITVFALARLGIAKAVVANKKELDGSHTVSYLLTVKNYGDTPLSSIQIIDDLVKVFPLPIAFSVVGEVSTTGTLIANKFYNGSAVTSLLETGSKFEPNQSGTIRFTVNVKLNNTASGTFNNTAEGNANSLGVNVTDHSTDGINPDPDGDGNPQESIVTPVILEQSAIRIPQGFSPNNDGVHDRFIIDNTPGHTIQLEVFNRWGNIVYKDMNYQNDWSGQSNQGVTIGQDLPDGTYYYVVTVDGKDKYVKYLTIKR